MEDSGRRPIAVCDLQWSSEGEREALQNGRARLLHVPVPRIRLASHARRMSGREKFGLDCFAAGGIIILVIASSWQDRGAESE